MVMAAASSALRSGGVPGTSITAASKSHPSRWRSPQRQCGGVRVTVRHLSAVDATEQREPPPQRPTRLADVIEPGLPGGTPDTVQARTRRNAAVPGCPAQVLPGRPVLQKGRGRGGCWRCHLATAGPHVSLPPYGVPGEPSDPRTEYCKGSASSTTSTRSSSVATRASSGTNNGVTTRACPAASQHW